PVSYGPKVWPEAQGADRYRRALYTFRFRSVPYPMLQTFDSPNGESSCVRRARSNTPLQALTTLNEPMFLDAARALALKTLEKAGAEDTQRMTYAFRRVIGRGPSGEESAELMKLLRKETDRYSDGKRDPLQLAPLSAKNATAAQTAAW